MREKRKRDRGTTHAVLAYMYMPRRGGRSCELKSGKFKYCGDSTVNRSLIVMCEYIVNKSANGLGGKNRGIVYREKIPQFCI